MKTRVFSDSTARTYNYCLAHWHTWVAANRPKLKRKSRPEELESAILDYIKKFDLEQKSLATLNQHIAAIDTYYSTRVRTVRVVDAIRQFSYDHGRPPRKAPSIGLEQLSAMVEVSNSIRDRAILTVGWSGALRANELVSIRRDHLELKTEGFVLTIPRSKTDQFGRGKTIPLPYFHVGYASICPARALEQYLLHQTDLFIPDTTDFVVFPLSTRQISRIVARAGRLAGLPAKYSSHSLRRGLATTAAQHSVDDRVIMRHGRWRSREMVDEYVDEGTLWSRTALDFLR